MKTATFSEQNEIFYLRVKVIDISIPTGHKHTHKAQAGHKQAVQSEKRKKESPFLCG